MNATIINGVTGFPLGHTLSPQLHGKIYEMLGLNAVMKAFPAQDIQEVLQVMRAQPLELLAVTLPHKQEVMKYLDDVDEEAKIIGAVNTVVNRGGKLYGYNTDIAGISEALSPFQLKGENCLILGAGGVARPVAHYLKKCGANIFCFNRTREKADELMKEFGGITVSNIESQPENYKLLVNATPVGMYPNISVSPFPEKLLNASKIVFDLIYNPHETKLLSDAKKRGALSISGLTMFLEQACEQVRIWSGKVLEEQQKAKLKTYLENLISSQSSP